MPASPTTDGAAIGVSIHPALAPALQPGRRGFAVYVHWPFCAAKCPYCDFNSHVRNGVDQDVWGRALLAEIDHTAALIGPRDVTSVFFGGGTPSLMQPSTAAAVIERIGDRWALAPGAEITLEANPTSAEAGKFRDLAAAGVNRFSLGVQALDDGALAFLGRKHSAGEALQALDAAAAVAGRWSFDLIYGRPDQTVEAWRAELDRALTLGADHMSLYQLTIEPGTAFHGAHARGDLKLPDEDRLADLYELTQDMMGAACLPAYETSNHARSGQESRHNLTYWRYGEYAGIGPGAHGRLIVDGQRHAVTRRRLPERWLAAVSADGHGTDTETALAREDRAAEMVMMTLRLVDGLSRAEFAAEIGDDPVDWIGADRVDRLVELDLLSVTATDLVVRPAGRPLLNSLLAELLA